MAKKKKRSRDKKEVQASTLAKTTFLDRLETPTYIIGFFVLLFIVMAMLYRPLLTGLEPSGSDIVSGIGKTHQMKLWEQKTGHYPLWNPAMFGGMPMYHRFAPKAWSIDTLLNHLDFLGDWRLWYFLCGALGIFLLVKFLGLSAAAGMLSALAFILMPHFQALIIVGHYAKFRAIMWMPYVLLTALLLIKKRDILSALLFALALALQFRTQHYQIMFYTLLLVLFMGIPPLYRLLREKDWKSVGRIAGLSLGALILTLLIVAQNLLSIKEYTPYSTRGGYAISIQDKTKEHQEKKGVGFDYATRWSYSVSEFWNLVIPRFHGGTSNERYTGNLVPGWKDRQLPTYWGSMPFTQSYEYIGIIIAFLALIAVVFQWQRTEVKSLTLLTGLALLMALGKNFAVLYRAFFYYVPYFDKFRVPMMILTLVMFTTALLAAYGLSFLLTADFSRKELVQKFYILSGVFGFLLLIPLIFGSSFSLSHPGEIQRYGQDVVTMFKKIRLEMLRNSALTSLLFFLVGFAGIFAAQKKWLRTDYLPVLFILIVAIDFLALDSHYIKGKFTDPKQAEQQQYRTTAIDKVLMQDTTLYRVFPVGQLFQDTRWCYRYQSIGGYSPAKMQTIQEIVDNCLYVNVGDPLPFNWNVLDMLNVKYLIVNQKLSSPRLKPVAFDQGEKLYAYRNSGVLPRAFFVDTLRVIPDGVKRLSFLNSTEFKPARMAILEKTPGEIVRASDSTRVKITRYEPERIELNVYTAQPALLVLSEIYYPKGWHAFLDGERETEIYKTNHLLRSVIVPAGSHRLSFTFHPRSYYAGLRISTISLIITYLLILGALYFRYRDRLFSSGKNPATQTR